MKILNLGLMNAVGSEECPDITWTDKYNNIKRTYDQVSVREFNGRYCLQFIQSNNHGSVHELFSFQTVTQILSCCGLASISAFTITSIDDPNFHKLCRALITIAVENHPTPLLAAFPRQKAFDFMRDMGPTIHTFRNTRYQKVDEHIIDLVMFIPSKLTKKVKV